MTGLSTGFCLAAKAATEKVAESPRIISRIVVREPRVNFGSINNNIAHRFWAVKSAGFWAGFGLDSISV